MSAHVTDDGRGVFIDGLIYTDVLQHLHDRFEPRSYFEIGTLFGDTLKLARGPSVAVDPEFHLKPEYRFEPERVKLRRMTSDDYFARFSPRRDFRRRIDLAFLDGMHKFSFLLRDFINTEKYCSPRSIIVMHDCIPLDYGMTRDLAKMDFSNNPTGYWTGDVWKIVPVLRKYRPDLAVECLDSIPTGLTICRNLDAHNTVLADRYDEIVRDWEDLSLDDFGMTRLLDAAQVQSAAAWVDRIESLRLHPLRQLGALVQPRRRLLEALSAVGLA